MLEGDLVSCGRLHHIFSHILRVGGKKIGGSEEKVTSPFMGSWWCHVTTHRFLGLQVNQLLRVLIGWWAVRGEGVFFSFFLSSSLPLAPELIPAWAHLFCPPPPFNSCQNNSYSLHSHVHIKPADSEDCNIFKGWCVSVSFTLGF